MTTVNQLLTKLTSIDISDVIDKSLIQVETKYVEAQRSQMLEGINSEGKPIGRYKNPVYKAMKIAQNPQAGGMVDLFRKGDFSRATFAIADNEGLRVGSFDNKSNTLEEKYGNVIWTLSPKNKTKFVVDNLRPVAYLELIKRFK